MQIDRAGLKKVPDTGQHNCFGCGPANPAGLGMRFWTDAAHVYSFLSLPETMCGWGRIAHGGILSVLLDEIMGWTVICLLRKIGVTKNMRTRFIKPVRVGEELTVVGEILDSPSERQALTRGAIYSAGGVLCAEAEGEFSVMTEQAAVRLGIMANGDMESFQPVWRQSDAR